MRVSGPGHRHALRRPSLSPSRHALRARTSSASTDAAIALSVRVVLLSRVLVWVAAIGALALFGKDAAYIAGFDHTHVTEPFRGGLANDLFAPTARWDSVWYLRIAAAGYYTRAATAFFPLYPLLIHGGAALFGSELVVGALISLAAMALGLVALHRLVALDLGESHARLTLVLVAFFPTAFFLSAVYTESLYLALSVGAIYAARRDRWAWAAALGALAAATRSSGVLLVIPLMLLYLYGPRAGMPFDGSRARRLRVRPRAGASSSRAGTPPVDGAADWWRPRYRFARSALWIALVPAGVISFMAYTALAHGSALAPFQAEDLYWGRQFAGLFGAAREALKALPGDIRVIWSGSSPGTGSLDPLTEADHGVIDVGFLVFAAVGLIAAWRRIPFAYIAYTLALLAEALSYPTQREPLASFGRYLLVMFPIFIGWSTLLAPRRRLTAGVLASSALLLVLGSGLWAMWAWIA
jgi:hypothetical protein